MPEIIVSEESYESWENVFLGHTLDNIIVEEVGEVGLLIFKILQLG